MGEGVRVVVGVGVQVGNGRGVDVSVGSRVGVDVSVGVKVAVGNPVGVSAAAAGIKNAVGGTIRVGMSHEANAFGEQLLSAIAPAPIPATFKKSRRETRAFFL